LGISEAADANQIITQKDVKIRTMNSKFITHYQAFLTYVVSFNPQSNLFFVDKFTGN
jgi:hypothetical protein